MMTLIDRLRALGLRREAEGLYTDQNICESAIEEINRLQRELRKRDGFNPDDLPTEIPE
jgi:hypothetical protein